ncbi:MAG: LppP/LprE family lipoprotein [Chloroflexota bacterium]
MRTSPGYRWSLSASAPSSRGGESAPFRRCVTSIRAVLVACAVVFSLGGPAISAVHAQSSWLDEPIRQWNQPGMSVPNLQKSETEPGLDPRCMATSRPAETVSDAVIESAGWSLFNTYEAGWGISLIYGLSGHDGMCRPWAYHAFVFVDGAFAGTLAPLPSLSRTDGALGRDVRIEGDGRLGAVFIRYAAEDPLCCPSRPSVAVNYRVERTPSGPVLLVERKSEIPRG